MVADPAALRREVHQLIDVQIETLQQRSPLTDSQLRDFKARSEKIRDLYGELDQIGRENRIVRFARAC
jgi:hypothetical protein